MEEPTIQFVAILVTVAGLLGWLLKQVIAYFIKSSNSKMAYIETLVAQNQKNVASFTDTVNHQRTLDRDMQSKHLDTLRELKDEMSNANKINSAMIEVLKKKP